ncbi:conserved protein of unknown function [Burkholderia multivorans]
MKKNDFLGKNIVKQFVEWMSARLDSETFRHGYVTRKRRREWACDDLHGAFTGYDWPHRGVKRLGVPAGTSFESSAAALDALRRDLQVALSPTPDDAAALAAACDVMRWGGVSNGNVSWLEANADGLAKMLIEVRDALDAGDTGHPTLVKAGLRFNAGMTKVYSLICKDFIIYDSRVAAALGWAVVKFCRERSLATVPAELAFAWAPAKEAAGANSPKLRNPATDGYVFPGLGGGTAHAQANLLASWLLAAVLDHPNVARSRFALVEDRANRLRALEAALFMVGYDLGGTGAAVPVGAVATVEDDEEWINCCTLAQGSEFKYKVDREGIAIRRTAIDRDGNAIRRAPLRFSDETIDGTLNWLYERFGASRFPLANSADAVPAGLAEDGLGVAYHAVTGGGNAPDTSKLAAALVDMSVISRVRVAGRAGTQLCFSANALDLVSRLGRFDFRKFIDEYGDDDEA